jgi:hypothetical protein
MPLFRPPCNLKRVRGDNGTQAAPERSLYDFRPEEHGPSDHLLRRVDRFLDLREERQTLRPLDRTTGCSSVDPGGQNPSSLLISA